MLELVVEAHVVHLLEHVVAIRLNYDGPIAAAADQRLAHELQSSSFGDLEYRRSERSWHACLAPSGHHCHVGLNRVIRTLVCVVAFTSCGSAKAETARNTTSGGGSTPARVPWCQGPPYTYPTLGQSVVPVQVPCDCPTAAVLPMRTTGDSRAAAVRAAMRWVTKARHWQPGQGHLLAIYRVGHTSQGAQFASMFGYSVPTFCGKKAADASYGVELVNPTVHDTGSQGDVVVAHFKDGWQVWGSYHP
jgi:hypothetical protein